MAPRTPLPSPEAVDAAQTALLTECAASGVRPTVVALARRLGLSNPTFWRHFPHHAEQVAAAGRRRPGEGQAPGRVQLLEHHSSGLRRDNRSLSAALKLAEADIQQLALENHQLRQGLEAARGVAHLDERRQPGRPATE